MNLLSKYALYIIEAIGIAAIVMWFVWKDPLQIFSSHRVFMAQTTIQVKDIQTIGKLVTAEYYGEVIANLPESKLTEDKSFYETVAANLYDTLIYCIYRTDSVVQKLHKPWWQSESVNFYKHFREINASLRSNIFYFPFIIYVDSVYEYENQVKRVNFDKVKDYKDNLTDYEEPVILKIREKLTQKKKEDPLVVKFDKFPRTYEKYVKHSPFKSERKKEILLLGRGWIKAGIDFGTITSSNFKYLKDKGIIHFYRLQPTILYHDINPWLVPKKIPGFEYVKISGKATNPDDIVSVKRACLEKLKQQALDFHILEKAKENATENLKSFFSILTGSEIKEVKFIFSKYDAYRDIFSSNILSASLYLSFDTLYKKDYQTLDTSWYKAMHLQKMELDSFFKHIKSEKKVQLPDKVQLKVTKYTSLAVNLTNDHKIDTLEMNSLNKIYKEDIKDQKFGKADSLWYKTKEQRERDFFSVWCKLLLPKYPENIDKDFLRRLKEEKDK